MYSRKKKKKKTCHAYWLGQTKSHYGWHNMEHSQNNYQLSYWSRFWTPFSDL